MSGPDIPSDDDDHIVVPRDQYIQLVSDLWDSNQALHDKLKEAADLARGLQRRNEVLEKWTRGVGHTAELIDLADVIAEIAANNPPEDARLAKAFEIARRFVAENPKPGRAKE